MASGARSSWPRPSRACPGHRLLRGRRAGLAPPHPFKVQWSFEDELPTDEGWAKLNHHYFRRDYAGFARFFFEEITSEPHSTKQIEDAVDWALEGSIDAMIADNLLAQDFELDDILATSAPFAARCCSSTGPRTPASPSSGRGGCPS